MYGALRKLERLFHHTSRKAALLPMDHGAAEGLLPGLARLPELVQSGAAGSDRSAPCLQGVVLNKGLARAHALTLPPELFLILQLSAGTKHGQPTYNKAIVCSVHEALRLGADAVSLHVNIGNDLEDRMLGDLGLVTDEAHSLGLPVLATIYARGERIVNELDPTLISHCIRLGGELGADLVCVPYSGDKTSFAAAVAASPAPVLLAGGPRTPNLASFLTQLEEGLACGAAGSSVGRVVFQDDAPEEALGRLLATVHGRKEEGA